MKIAVDVMGGDFAPQELVRGAAQFAETGAAGLLLVGIEAEIRKYLPELPAGCEIVHTDEFVGMGEPPAQALRKKRNASVALASRLVKEGRAQAVLSAGSTGAQMAAALLEIGRIPGVERPAVAVVLPATNGNGVVVLDVGANVDCRPAHLVQFGIMGAAYSQGVLSVSTPRVALLNVGSEEGKGNDQVKAAFPLFRESSLNFIGNVEADHLFSGVADVVVCDGFVGNVLLKASEGVSEAVLKAVKEGVARAGSAPEIGAAVLGSVKRYRSDAPEYSAAPLLGIAGCSIVCHGKSKAPVIANALHLAVKYASTDVVGLISQETTGTNIASG
jgi:glycerol-3-phosphate acyltransferase PlsX